MASSNKTSLGLNVWSGSDAPERNDFNEDNKIIDQSLSSKANLNDPFFTGKVSMPWIQVQHDSFGNITFQNADGTVIVASIVARTDNGDLVLRNNVYGTELQFFSGALRPNVDNQIDLGSAGLRWKNGYFATAPAVGSDQRIKKDISPLKVSVLIKLLMSIPPVQYRLIDGQSGRFHYGFLAQDVERALTKAELSDMDFAGLIKSPVLDDNGSETGDHIYALRLEEFIPILWAHQQDLERRMQALEVQLS